MEIKFIIATSIAFSLLISCQKSRSTESKIPSTEDLTTRQVAGLSLKLPFGLAEDNTPLPSAAEEMIKSHHSYLSGRDRLKIGVTHVVYKATEANLDGATNGAIDGIRALPGVSSFSSSIEAVELSGLEGKSVAITYRNLGHELLQYALIFVRKNEMWQIQIIAENGDDNAKLAELKDAVFESVEVMSD